MPIKFEEHIPDNRLVKPDPVIKFENQEEIGNLSDCEECAKNLTIVYFMEHVNCTFTGLQGGPVRSLNE